jgi:hypothetical protein
MLHAQRACTQKFFAASKPRKLSGAPDAHVRGMADEGVRPSTTADQRLL